VKRRLTPEPRRDAGEGSGIRRRRRRRRRRGKLTPNGAQTESTQWTHDRSVALLSQPTPTPGPKLALAERGGGVWPPAAERARRLGIRGAFPACAEA